jgi:hypothetical protein
MGLRWSLPRSRTKPWIKKKISYSVLASPNAHSSYLRKSKAVKGMTLAILFIIGTMAVSAVWYVRIWWVRNSTAISPILLEDVLDPDIRELCLQLRARHTLSPTERERYARLVVRLASNRECDNSSDEDESALVLALRALQS